MLDLRTPIGLFFIVVGAITLAAGYVAPHARREGIDIDIYWGEFLLAFGLIMAIFGAKAQQAVGGDLDSDAPSDAAAGSPATPPHSAAQDSGSA